MMEGPSLMWVLGLKHLYLYIPTDKYLSWVCRTATSHHKLQRECETWILLHNCGCKDFFIFPIQMLPEFEHWAYLKGNNYILVYPSPRWPNLNRKFFFFSFSLFWEYPDLYYKGITLLYNQNCFLNHSQYF